MRRLELSDEEHQVLLEAVRRQHRQTLDPRLRELHQVVDAAPRVLVYCVSVDLPQPPVSVGPGPQGEIAPGVQPTAAAVGQR